MMLADADARSEALDVCKSFCISAPAGSGKTSLLVQRTLALLARVDNPESVVAVTFTRKAAAEMRARIVFWLRQAASGESSDDEHEATMLQLAGEVLKCDQAKAWGLATNSSRLRIQTIDSFCGELTRQMPILSGCGGPLTPSDRSEPLYRAAIESFLVRELEATNKTRRADISALMLHLDNQWETAVELLSGLLQRREQWQPVFGGSGLEQGDRLGLREVTETLVEHRLEQLRENLRPWLRELTELMSYRHSHLPESQEFNPQTFELAAWRELRALLLTNDNTPRKTLTKREGFPAGKGVAAEKKAQALALVQMLADADHSATLTALQQLRHLPATDADASHWDVLAALTRLLPRLGAELLLVFQQSGEVDHAQIAMAAIAALGADEAPTDIALRLDHSIEHLLVDEFQDTSSLQFELIRRLTRGWNDHNRANPQAPRTLLVVGDAMQSIYGFRAANVGLFIRARDEGVGDLNLVPLDLSVNFRSQEGLVEWVNQHFETAFPAGDDAQLGAVSFRRASAARRDPGMTSPDANLIAHAPHVQLFAGEGAAQAEVEALCDRLAAGLHDESVESIAVLGRSRTHLHPVLFELRERSIEVAAHDLDPLSGRPIIRDLVTLCTVLLDRFDRLSWLALVRCPAVALDHEDLLQLALHAPLAADFLDQSPRAQAAMAAISVLGRKRMQGLSALLRWAERYQDRLSLRVWVEECWLRFGGAAGIAGEADHKDAEQFFQCLERLEAEQRPLSRRSLSEAVDQLFAAPANERCKIQVMTLHKAKGLEFDWVFIPSLSRATRGNDKELLLWEETVLPGQAPFFLLDVRSSLEAGASNRLYDYLRAQAQQRQRLEATRLFYVGCTRAADYLWLSASLSWDEKTEAARPPGAGSLLSSIWESLQNVSVVPADSAPPSVGMEVRSSYSRLRTLPVLEGVAADAASVPRDLEDASRVPRAFGTAVHRCLEALVYRDKLPLHCDTQLEKLLESTLYELGAPQSQLKQLQAVGKDTLDRVLADPWAQWMLSPARAERSAELSLTMGDAAITGQVILDYVFMDEVREERWVIDYKTATPKEHESVEEFFQRQLALYHTQLARYAAALRASFGQPVRCALYFTALGKHCEWQQP
ncbi:MAG: UvrD-helicase domain-containing protein [Congregibacter sp.]